MIDIKYALILLQVFVVASLFIFTSQWKSSLTVYMFGTLSYNVTVSSPVHRIKFVLFNVLHVTAN